MAAASFFPRECGPLVARGILSALVTEDHPLTPAQRNVLVAVAARFGDPALDPQVPPEPIDATELRTRLTDPDARRALAHLVVVSELIAHPLAPEVEDHAERYLHAAGIEVPYVAVCRDTARDHLARLHADIIRNSWATEQTVKGIFHGKLLELARSKLAYYGVGTDQHIARRWQALGDCPPGSWGGAVHGFYRAHDFPFPGEAHGIYEVGALHDWIHVLADYGTSPEGEIDVFAFIAGTMEDPKGFVALLFTLALFQNATMQTVGGKHVAIARADTLDDPGAPDRLADALWRAASCTTDVMGAVDVWTYAERPLDELRAEWSIPPKSVAGPGAFD